MHDAKINFKNVFDLHLGERKRKLALKWTCFNICMLAILIFDIYKTYQDYDLIFFYLESAACFVLMLSLLKNLITLIYYTFFIDLVVCENEDQRILLNLSSSNSLIKSKSQVAAVKKQDTDETIYGSVKSLSWQSWGDCKLF
jgi:hypothetical protein